MEEEYAYIELQKGEIRVLEILPGQPHDPLQCHLRTISLGDEDIMSHYAAVSYAWGDDLSDRTIIVDGRRLSVKPNLEAALLEFRREPPRLIPECTDEKVSAAANSISILFKCHGGSFSEASRLDYEALENTMASWRTALDAALDQDSKEAASLEFPKDAEKMWNRIADREAIPRLYGEPVWLWIDGICINQKDDTERNAQVQMMARIYSKAQHLVIWLGPGDESTNIVLDIVSDFLRKDHEKENDFDAWLTTIYKNQQKDIFYDVLLHVLSAPWFCRAWINQEYCLGAQQSKIVASQVEPIMVCYGVKRIRDFVSRAVDPNGIIRKLPRTSVYVVAVRLLIARMEYELRRNGRILMNETSKGVYLLNTVAQMSESQCTDPRDRIYSCLGLASACFDQDFEDYVPPGLIVNYDISVEEVYSSFVRAITEETKRLDILVYCSGTLTKHVHRTWAPDWDVQGEEQIERFSQYVFMMANHPERSPFDVAPRTHSISTFVDDLTTLTISGFIYDRLTAGSSMIVRRMGEIKHMEELFLMQRGHSISGRRKFREALLRALRFDPKTSEEELKEFKKYLEESNDLRTLIRSVTEYYDNHRNVSRKGRDHYMIINSLLFKRTIVLTDGNSIIRPISDHAKSGNLICVILGCAMPMLLHPVDSHYEVHGAVYAPDIMHGEAMKALEEGKIELQDFELH